MNSHEQLMTLKIPSQKGFEKIAMAVVRCLAEEIGLPPRKLQRLKTALAEAVLNAMEHGNQSDARLDVTIRFLVSPKKLEITVQDAGKGGQIHLPTEAPDIDRKVLGLAPHRGWGLFLIGKLVDEFGVDGLPGNRNRVRLVSYVDR